MLLVDEDLGELIILSDRIAVMYKGEIVGVLMPEQFSSEEIGLLMTGAKKHDFSSVRLWPDLRSQRNSMSAEDQY